ncbi:MAG: hypothetical protein HGB01_05330 [Chlorobiaceae bacterium]|nr:hypothetical protein [Chlorobiaceae bacterium]
MKKRALFMSMSIMLLLAPQSDTHAAPTLAMAVRSGSDIRIERRPDFIFLDSYGFQVSWGAPYDVIHLDNNYFLHQADQWYRAADYRGPWKRIDENRLPSAIRKHSWLEITEARETEYRKHDRRFWEEKFRKEHEAWLEYENFPGPRPRPDEVIWP